MSSTNLKAKCATCGKPGDILLHRNDSGCIVAVELQALTMIGEGLFALQCQSCAGKGGKLVVRTSTTSEAQKTIRSKRREPRARFTSKMFLHTLDRLHLEQGGKYYVSLADMRDAHPGVSRQAFDTVLHDLRKTWTVTASPAEGRHETVPKRVIEAGINEAGRNLVYVSRREQ